MKTKRRITIEVEIDVNGDVTMGVYRDYVNGLSTGVTAKENVQGIEITGLKVVENVPTK